jgi:hypothetical protein
VGWFSATPSVVCALKIRCPWLRQTPCDVTEIAEITEITVNQKNRR